MDEKNGGAAFPSPDERGPDGCGIRQGSSGMSLRDYFAAAALQGMCGTGTWPRKDDGPLMAERAYAWADAMLRARRSQES